MREAKLLGAHDTFDESPRGRIRQERGPKIEHLSPLADLWMPLRQSLAQTPTQITGSRELPPARGIGPEQAPVPIPDAVRSHLRRRRPAPAWPRREPVPALEAWARKLAPPLYPTVLAAALSTQPSGFVQVIT